MIEPLFIDPNGSTEEREKINEIIDVLNQLTRPDTHRSLIEDDRQFVADHSEQRPTRQSAAGIQRPKPDKR